MNVKKLIEELFLGGEFKSSCITEILEFDHFRFYWARI